VSKIFYEWLLLLYSFGVCETQIYIVLHVCSATARFAYSWAIISVCAITDNIIDILSYQYNTHSLMSTLGCSLLQLPLLLHICGVSDCIRIHYDRQCNRHSINSVQNTFSDVDPRLLSSAAAAANAHVWGVRLYPYTR